GTLRAVRRSWRMAADRSWLAGLAGVRTVCPQGLVNGPNVDTSRADSVATLQEAVAQATSRRGGSCRVLLRGSGTEPLVRVMVEAPTGDEARAVAEHLAGVVSATLRL